MYFFSTWYLIYLMKWIISFVNHLYNNKIDEIKSNCILSTKKTSHYIYNLLFYIFWNFLKMSWFLNQIKTLKIDHKIKYNSIERYSMMILFNIQLKFEIFTSHLLSARMHYITFIECKKLKTISKNNIKTMYVSYISVIFEQFNPF